MSNFGTSHNTCVWVNPKLAANSARSGSAKYCVLWNLLFNCCNWRLEYMVRGFLIFFPFPFTRSAPSSTPNLSGKIMNESMNRVVLKENPRDVLVNPRPFNRRLLNFRRRPRESRGIRSNASTRTRSSRLKSLIMFSFLFDTFQRKNCLHSPGQSLFIRVTSAKYRMLQVFFSSFIYFFLIPLFLIVGIV